MNILGTYSGIGMETVDQLIEAEKAKGVRFTNKKSKIETQQSAWKDISTRLNSLYGKIEALQKPGNFLSQTVNSSIKNSPFLSITSNEKAASGTYRIGVEQIATSSRLTSGKITNVESIDDEFISADGTLTITVGGEEGEKTSFDISLKANDSLRTITETINKETKETGIKASIVDNRLVLTDTKMGERTIEVNSDGSATDIASELNLTNLAGESDTDPFFVTGNKARITIDGMVIHSDTNKIDAIEGLTIDLTGKHASDQTELITVAQDTQKTVDTVKEFVDQYNSVMNFINKQTDAGDPSAEENKSGALVGESSLLRLQSSLRSLLTRNLKSGPEDKAFNLSELGIEVDRYGVATLDEEALREKVLEDPANVARAFYQPESANIEGSDAAAKTGSAKGGMSELLKNLVDGYISKDKGIIKTKQESYDRVLKDISKQIETFDTRIEGKRARYIREFTALDQAMMQAESQMEYLYSQMGMGQD